MFTFDAHIDVPWQMIKHGAYDLHKPHPATMVDFPRMKEGGLDAAIFALYLSEKMQDGLSDTERDAAVDFQIEAVRALGLKPQIYLALEGGRLLGTKYLKICHRLEKLKQAGIKYLTLTHNRNTAWADSATDIPEHHGLTNLGMNIVRLAAESGILIDVSHASDETCQDVLDMGVPVIASHSGCRALVEHPRNLSDALIVAIAACGGIICVPFAKRFIGERVSDHIAHIIRLLGDAKHVGIGSDLDGALMVAEVRDVRDWRKVTVEALDDVYFGGQFSTEDIENVVGGNLRRAIK